MLAEMVNKYGANVWLMNTGWSGGKYGVGQRMSLKISRTILDNIHSGALDNAEFETMKGFNLQVPKKLEGIDSSILMPVNTWADKADYKETSKKLAGRFINNFKKYQDGTPKEVIEKGGPTLDF
jgi:phosphoenolpyruvate carboxykinase (ATP)